MNFGSFSWWFHEKFLNLQRVISKTEEVWSSNIKEKEPKKSLSLGSNRLLPRKKNGWRLIIWKSFWEEGAYQFIIGNETRQKSPNDAKLRDTITCIIEAFYCRNLTKRRMVCPIVRFLIADLK